MMQRTVHRGEIWRRGDVYQSTPAVLVVSNDLFNRAGAHLIVCPITPVEPGDHHAATVPITEPIPGIIVPGLVTWLIPASLTERIGSVSVDIMDRVHAIITAALSP